MRSLLEPFAVKNNINFSLPTAFIWEGVTSFLKAEAVDKTFEFVDKFPKGSSIVFTYLNRYVLDNPSAFKGASKIIEILNKADEKWTFGFYPEKLSEYLNSRNLKLVEDKNVQEIREQYLKDRKDLLKGLRIHRIAFAKKL